MGNIINIECELCKCEWGSIPIFYISSFNNLNGHILCINCFELKNNNLISNIKFNNLECEWCKYNSNNRDIPVFKIYWKGKFGNHTMCQKCIYNRENRQQVL